MLSLPFSALNRTSSSSPSFDQLAITEILRNFLNGQPDAGGPAVAMAATKSSCLSPLRSCHPNSLQTFVDDSPVQPSRPPSNYRIDTRPSIQISERSAVSGINLPKVASTSIKEFPAHALRHKKACEALHEAAASTSKPARHQRTSSLEKAMKKLHELFKGREDSTVSFASVLQKAEELSASPIVASGNSS